jgi:terminase large subunit-like protein
MPEISPSKYLVTAGWDNAPHLDEKTKEEMLRSTPPFLRDARSKGIPSLGSGAIYPIPESEISSPYFPIPYWWPRCYGLDVGWNRTAALWAAWDPSTGICYLYAEHYRGIAEPAVHAEAIKARGEWMSGVCDPAARGSSQRDGEKLIDLYRQLGLKLTLADNAVDAGIYDTWASLSVGKLKVMSHLLNFFNEYRLYRRDEHGRIVKKHDHLMDVMRYIVRSGRAVSRTPDAGNKVGQPDAVEPMAGY